MGWKVIIQIKINRDVLQLIAEQITDRKTWHSFALANSVTATIARRLKDQKKQEIENIEWNEFSSSLTDDELLQFDPNLSDHNTIAWTQNIGHRLISNVNIEIGGQSIVNQFDEWNTDWNELNVQGSPADPA